MDDRPFASLSRDYETLSLAEVLSPEGIAGFMRRQQEEPGDLFVRGILHRAGRAGFYYWLGQSREMLDWNHPDFRFSPVKKKITRGLAKICEVIGREKSNPLHLEEGEDRWEMQLIPSLSDQPGLIAMDCDYLAGFAQEFSSWAGLGKFYRVIPVREQTEGLTRCRIIILKNPIDE